MEGIKSKSLSLGEDSQISLEISICLAEDAEGFQQCVKDIFKLIEEDGNFSEMTVEIYDHKKSKLKAHVAELARMHGALVDQHVHLIEETSKHCSPLIKKHLDCSDSSSPQITQMFTPDQMSNAHKYRTPIGFDVLLSSGGGASYASRREGSESSFSLSSDSDSENYMSINKLLISPINDDGLKVKETKVPEALLKKISNLEEELVSLNIKLQSLAEENSKLKLDLQENESDIRTQTIYLETEKTKVSELQKQVADLKLVISDSNLKVKSMEDALEASREKLLSAEDEILELKHELSIKSSKLGSTQQEMALLQKQLDTEKESNLRLQEEVSLCVVDISMSNEEITDLNTKISQSISEISLLKSAHEANEVIWNADIEKLKMELREKCQSVDDLNKNLDSLKLKKDGVTAQLDTLQAEKRSQDNLVQELENHLDSLQVEYSGVLLSFDNEQKVTNELRQKVLDLEREVDRQREVMTDRAEEKREAIRQLSSSLEHYMSGYKELRQAFIGNKRHAVLTS